MGQLVIQRPAHGLQPYFLAGLATLFWGLSFVAVRVALETASPFGLVWMRNAIGAAFLLAVLALRREPLLPRAADRPRCLLLGLILGVHLLTQTIALRYTTAARAGWIITFVPVVVALASALFLRRRLSALGWAGMAVATAGAWLLTAVRPAEFADARRGDLLVLSTCFLWAGYTLLSVKPMRSSGALATTAFSLSIALIPSLCAALFAGHWQRPPNLISALSIGFLGFGASAIAMWSFNAAVAIIGPERAAAFQYVQPFVTMLGAIAVLHEPITHGVLIGGPTVLAGVWMIQRARLIARRSAQSKDVATVLVTAPNRDSKSE